MSDVKWIKISTNIFDDEKIQLIDSLPKADSILIIWFKLLCLAGKTNNSGVFLLNDAIPYTNEMLSKIFRRKKTTVESALKVFKEFGMIDIIDDVITIPKWGEHQSLDSIEKKKEYMKNYMQEYRSKQKSKICKSNSKANVSRTEEEIEKDKEDKNKNNKREVYYPNDEILDRAFADYVAMRKQIKKPMTERAIELSMKRLNDLSGGDNDKAVKILNQSVMNCWQGLFELKGDKQSDKIDWSRV